MAVDSSLKLNTPEKDKKLGRLTTKFVKWQKHWMGFSRAQLLNCTGHIPKNGGKLQILTNIAEKNKKFFPPQVKTDRSRLSIFLNLLIFSLLFIFYLV